MQDFASVITVSVHILLCGASQPMFFFTWVEMFIFERSSNESTVWNLDKDGRTGQFGLSARIENFGCKDVMDSRKRTHSILQYMELCSMDFVDSPEQVYM